MNFARASRGVGAQSVSVSRVRDKGGAGVPAAFSLRAARVVMFSKGYFYKLQHFVIPAKAGIQPIARSMGYEGLDPGFAGMMGK